VGGGARRTCSGTVTLAVTTALYLGLWYVHGPFLGVGAVVGAHRAGLHLLLGRDRGVAGRRVDRHGYTGSLDAVFARSEVYAGAGMLLGAAAAGTWPSSPG
jgi:hypothetical protein